ncbi:asparaginyl-tRNA synthetase [Guillardia theta CCMP2712]|uniref:asparagine--tRNA ligase n=1 Tax=Guillardia theta (strain CCMP2712) TaxID=905079 RepID=L1IEP1_GUITC|nr:asparaginyl-tRNA synthetase [Guillardia theta CCMP2712]EKX34562.1 asparaginyl-tRNA synthetase [Guillardia theta CCMP2712]|eukprot:XP_005821542.1 asparaginyl-tRNA synthetase [Guillardia theta CCMP2712]
MQRVVGLLSSRSRSSCSSLLPHSLLPPKAMVSSRLRSSTSSSLVTRSRVPLAIVLVCCARHVAGFAPSLSSLSSLQHGIRARTSFVCGRLPSTARSDLRRKFVAPCRSLASSTQDGSFTKDLEDEIKKQGDVVRNMKAAMKEDSASHSKEELDAAVKKLLDLKAKLEAPKQEEEKVAVVGDAPVRVSNIGPLALARNRLKVREIMMSQENLVGKEVIVKGWVRTVRSQKSFSFIELNDGSLPKGIQIVVNADLPTYAEVEKLCTGASVAVKGTIVESPGQGQQYEVAASEIELVGDCSGKDYPLQKKRHTLEFLRSIAHLRPRTNTLGSIARVRSALAQATHAFFQKQGFLYLQSPIITASDCEGAGEMFRVTTLPSEVDKLPKTKEGSIDYSKDFFGKPAYLTVSGQLSGETFACALGDIYTFGPTFRAENSQTSRHLAEFWMIEPEMAFADLQSVMENAEAYVKFVVKHALETCGEDLAFFNQMYDKTLLERLKDLVEKPFAKVSYSEAVELLQAEIAKDKSKWQYPDVKFGTDLRVAATDLLVPGIGELVGGSQREERLDVLVDKLKEFGLSPEDYWWYLDLRRYGSTPHAGYGLGFERLVCYVTATENIRDAIAYPRYPGNAEF